MANLNPTKPVTGGRKPGAGRPKGSKNINSMASVRKLEELGFDPIEMMVVKYQWNCKSWFGCLCSVNSYARHPNKQPNAIRLQENTR
jgi:hypothetical protein